MKIERVLIVSLGSIGKRHLRLARKLLPKADIRILRHQENKLVPEFSNGCFFQIEEAINFAPQIAVVANPASCHLDVALRLAIAGVHLLVEKPLSKSINGVDELLKVCSEKSITLLTGYNLRFLSSLQYFNSLLKQNLIGKILSVRCEIGQYLPSWRPDVDYRISVSAREELGGGALLELSHELDYLRWIFGEINWVQASLSHQSNLKITVEDSAHLILGFDYDGDGNQLIGTVNLDFIRHDTTRICTAIGETGSLRWNGITNDIELFEAGGQKWDRLFDQQTQRDASYLAEWKHFLACVNGIELPLVSGVDGLKVLQIIEAARKSSHTGRRISI